MWALGEGEKRMIERYDKVTKEWETTEWFDLGEIMTSRNAGLPITTWREEKHIYLAITFEGNVEIYRRIKPLEPAN